MEFEACYDLAKYMNDNNKGCFSNREIACRAFEIFEEIAWARRNKHLPDSLQETVKILLEDDTEESNEWIVTLVVSSGLDVSSVTAILNLHMQLKSMWRAFRKVYEAIEEYHSYSDESINELDGFVDLYPFSASLDEVASEVGTWGEKCSEALFKKL